jgi:hypothetical protein
VVNSDALGLSGTLMNRVFRILDAAVVKQVQEQAGADFALAVTDEVYRQVVEPGIAGIDADEFVRAEVLAMETRALAWLRVRGPGAEPGGPTKPVAGEDLAQPVATPRAVAGLPPPIAWFRRAGTGANPAR